MRKTFVLNWNKNSSSKFNFSYPDFKKEGLAALFPVFDWISHLTILSFFVMVFFVRSGNIFDVFYSASIVLFAVQLMRVVLGGLGYFPKTTLDVGGLLFVVFTIVAILLTGTQENSLFGEGKLSFLSGMSSFALLLIYYFTVSQSVLRGTAGFVKKAVILSVILLGLKLIGDREGLLSKEISGSYYLPLALPFLFFTFLQSNKFLKQVLLILAITMTLLLANFNDFSFTFSLLVSLFVLFLIVLLGGSEFLYKSVSNLGGGIGKILKGKMDLFGFLRSSGKFIIGSFGFFALFIFSIVKSVENFSDNFSKVVNLFKDTWNGSEGTKEIIFGRGLDIYSGSFYTDILNSYGMLGVAGFIFFAALAIFYILKTLKKAYKEKNSKLSLFLMGILTSFLSLLIYFKFESVTVYGYVILWFLLILAGAVSTVEIYKHKVVSSTVAGLSNSKNRRLVIFLKTAGILILAVVAIISVYLIVR